jgi:hypothetical protein
MLRAYQQILLSVQVLHFASSELIWDCHKLYCTFVSVIVVMMSTKT